jgi:hypothetical protein
MERSGLTVRKLRCEFYLQMQEFGAHVVAWSGNSSDTGAVMRRSPQ